MKVIDSDIKKNLKLFVSLSPKLPINIAQAYQFSSLWEPKKGTAKTEKGFF